MIDKSIRFELTDAATVKTQPYSFGYPDSQFGEIVYHRTYSRLMEDGRQETWPDTVVRVINGLFTIRKWWMRTHALPWDEQSMQAKALDMALSMLQMKWLPPGRGLWAMGTDYIYERGSMALYNCAYVEVENLAEDISWLMDALMCGVGVGFGISDKQAKLNLPGDGRWTFEIPDSREGWVLSVEQLLKSYVLYGRSTVEFNYDRIRPYGELIRGFGGRASGPEPLRLLHSRIRTYCEQYIREEINWTQLVANLANAAGVCVVVGNVRRSAEICLGSPFDSSFMDLKDYDKYPERMSVGWMSNNSARLRTRNDFLKLEDIAERVQRNGEPGIYNAVNVGRYARYGDTTFGPDAATGINPCGEIPLESYEVCNLSEVYPTRCGSRREFLQAAEHATWYSSTVSLLPTHSPKTNAVVARNRRIGVSPSGIAEWVDTWGNPRCTRWAREGYRAVREANAEANRQAGIPPSLRVTTVKPSGTISLLAGVSSGMHYPTFQYAVRRIVMDATCDIAKILMAANYPWEPAVEFLNGEESRGRKPFMKYDHMRPSENVWPYESETSIVVEVPIAQGQARPARDVSAWEQFGLLAWLQREWADNSVSCTVYFDPETEGPQVARMLGQYTPVIKSVSLLPHSDKGVYPQMPYESITKDEYTARRGVLEPIDWTQLSGSDGDQLSELYCTGDQCELPMLGGTEQETD